MVLLIFPRQCSNTLNGINFQSVTWKGRPQIPLPVMGFAHLALENAGETYLPPSNFQRAASKMLAKLRTRDLPRREMEE